MAPASQGVMAADASHVKSLRNLVQTAAMGSGKADGIQLDPPEMRQSIAWELALMAIKRHEAAEAERLLLTSPGTVVRDVQVSSLVSLMVYLLSQKHMVLLTQGWFMQSLYPLFSFVSSFPVHG